MSFSTKPRIYGLPDVVVSDNGVEFKNNDVVTALSTFGSSMEWCDAATPEQKARIERFFLTIDNEMFHSLRGTTKGKPSDLGGYDSEKMATMTIEDVREMFDHYVDNIYHQSFHRGIEDVPANKWAEGVQQNPPRMPASTIDLVTFLPGIETRTIQSKGIEFKTNFYNSPELAQLRNGEKGKRVRIKWNDMDLSHIFVENPETRQFFKVPSVNLALTSGLTMDAQKAKMKATNERRRIAERNPELAKARGELSDMIESFCQPVEQRKSTNSFDPYGKESKEIEIQRQNAAIPPSGPGFDDLGIGEHAGGPQDFGSEGQATNENHQNDDDFDAYEARRRGTIAGEE